MQETCFERLAQLENEHCVNGNCPYNYQRTQTGCAILERERFLANRRSGAISAHDYSSYFKLDDGSYITLGEGMTGTELADMIGCTRANVSQCTKRSLRRIRDSIENHL